MFAEEAGCFAFKKKQGASKYFTLCTVCTDDRYRTISCIVGNLLLGRSKSR
jgi:hypothetical protein